MKEPYVNLQKETYSRLCCAQLKGVYAAPETRLALMMDLVGDTAADTGAIRHPRGVTSPFDSRRRLTTGVSGRVAAVGIRRRRRRRGAWDGVWDVKHGRIRRLGARRVVRGRIRRRSRRIRRAGTRTAVITRAIRSELRRLSGRY